jgi:hypothetical protein
LAAETGGLSITASDKDELVAALQKTLTCPLFSELPSPSWGAARDGGKPND